MDSLHTGSDELVSILTDKISITVKGHPLSREIKDKESVLKVFSDEAYDISIDGKEADFPCVLSGNSYKGEYRTVPLFFEQRRYEIIIESLGGEKIEFWHDNFNIRNKVTAVGRNKNILSGIISFGNEIGMSDLIVRVDGVDYLRLTIEVFPSKISYKEDYQAIVADITAEVYNLIFDVLKKTYMGYRQNENVSSSPVEFFAVINKIFGDFLKATDLILSQPHHELQSTYEILPSYKIKRIDSRLTGWIAKHPGQVIKSDGKYLINKAESCRKTVTYDTKENRLTKYILQSTAKKLHNFKKNYMKLQRNCDEALLSEIDKMTSEINRRCNSGFLAEVTPSESYSGMSLVFSMAPGYRDLYKYFLMLQRGLSVTGDVFNVSVKDLALLYEYWCFIKLNSLMRDSDKYELVSQNIVRVYGNGLYISLAKGKSSTVKYRSCSTGELIKLSYNPKEISVPTIAQKPDNVLSLEKKGTDIKYEYVFDAKYRINPALPGTDYAYSIGDKPGPEVDDINTMHRYRDAIVYRNGASPFERTMFGAYVLFPYNNENEYREHRFYKSIEQVNIGGLPFLPSATGMVEDMLEQLISDSPESAFERATLPTGIEEKLAKVDWSVRDVFIGTLSSREQIGICLEHKFYHTPVRNIRDSEFPVHYVAMYQSTKKFGAGAGIYYYGEVTKCETVKRWKIKEIPKDSDDLYYRFEIKEWKQLSRPIAPKEIGFVKHFTNLFLLEHSSEIPELWIKSEEEYRLYSELKRSVNDTSINEEDSITSFNFNGFMLSFDEGKISVSKDRKVFAKYSINDFSKSPNAVFRRIRKDMLEIIE